MGQKKPISAWSQVPAAHRDGRGLALHELSVAAVAQHQPQLREPDELSLKCELTLHAAAACTGGGTAILHAPSMERILNENAGVILNGRPPTIGRGGGVGSHLEGAGLDGGVMEAIAGGQLGDRTELTTLAYYNSSLASSDQLDSVDDQAIYATHSTQK